MKARAIVLPAVLLAACSRPAPQSPAPPPSASGPARAAECAWLESIFVHHRFTMDEAVAGSRLSAVRMMGTEQPLMAAMTIEQIIETPITSARP